jgi:hypothetical protein
VPRAEETADRWFDDPAPGDRQPWVVPPGHGSYRGLDLELLHLADEAELTFPIESIHPELAHALGSEDEVIVGGEPFRLAALGYDWRRK